VYIDVLVLGLCTCCFYVFFAALWRNKE